MTQAQLHRSVARATGEDVDLIACRGFSLVDEEVPLASEDWEELALDWDDFDEVRRGDRLSIAA